MTNKSRVIVAGATGFIGREVTARLIEDGYQVTALARDIEEAKKILNVKSEILRWNGEEIGDWAVLLENAAGIVNLAGDNIGHGRWSNKKKNRIRESRIRTTRLLVESVKRAKNKPRFFIQASAIGFYGSGSGEKTEDSPPGEGFLAEVVKDWEVQTSPLKDTTTRRIILRFGVVLGRGGGIYEQIRPRPMRFKIGSVPGPGDNSVSWIHIKDLTEVISFIIGREDLSGVFNVTSPKPISMEVLTKAIAESLEEKVWLRIPKWVLYMALGREKAKELVLSDVHATPKRLLEVGFNFNYTDIYDAAKELASFK